MNRRFLLLICVLFAFVCLTVAAPMSYGQLEKLIVSRKRRQLEQAILTDILSEIIEPNGQSMPYRPGR
ncbi:unnamed protein product, partial [Mesorhabditis belari]|uniref:Uncharacterized protein n=1 Tax=Mesorhabditis belari TaxID=2138241 RepID=A0AAF3FDI4_9BILA